ncbi:MAG: hypothetical protein QOK29_3712 [Rhodospirillaceae bacterium]|nr:hypothetical protein [Rhodospirillaceae bacterium]
MSTGSAGSFAWAPLPQHDRALRLLRSMPARCFAETAWSREALSFLSKMLDQQCGHYPNLARRMRSRRTHHENRRLGGWVAGMPGMSAPEAPWPRCGNYGSALCGLCPDLPVRRAERHEFVQCADEPHPSHDMILLELTFITAISPDCGRFGARRDRLEFRPLPPPVRFAGSPAAAVRKRAGRRGACGRDRQSPFAER